jgi:3-hydroxyisobutyrate dehydrogenase-like beta-hydroxyacid dehydrogenase
LTQPSRRIGILHPGQMGAAIGALLVTAGHQVMWASAGRGAATVERAQRAGLRDVGDIAAMATEAEVIFSICPPFAALDLAEKVAGFAGLFVDANAVSPATVARAAERIESAGGHVVDGGIIGGPPTAGAPTRAGGQTRLYLSGPRAAEVSRIFNGTALDCPVLSAEVGAASALKMAFAGWTKGRNALLLTMREYARAAGVDDALVHEWRISLPGLEADYEASASSAAAKGWRWASEMAEVAQSLAAVDLPAGFHLAAAEVFERQPRPTD